MQLRSPLRSIAVLSIACSFAPVPAFANSVVGEWSALINWDHIAVAAAALPDGTIATWSSFEVDEFRRNTGTPFTYSAVFDPATGNFETTNNTRHDMFCPGVSQLIDGDFFVSGGNSTTQSSSRLSSDNHNWIAEESMRQGRWYGTNLTLTNGDVLATFARGADIIPELWSPATGNWTDLPGASMQRLFDEQQITNQTITNRSAAAAQWYAFMHVAPDGRVFHSGPSQTMHWFDANGIGGVESAGTRGGDNRYRQFGTATLFNTGKLLVTGGADRTRADSSTATAMVIDINGTTPVVTPAPDMIAPRTSHNSVVLPTGEVMIVGGESQGVLFSDFDSVLDTEIWNPNSNSWRTTAPIAVPRNYHSIAILMEDGRVLSAGGGLCGPCGVNHQDAQIFSPPYLFDDSGNLRARPSVVSAPATTQAGGSFEITTDRPVERFSLLRLSAVTHSINADQRFIEPTVTNISPNRYRLTLPSNPNVVIAGNYWLHAIDSDGTPSVGRVIMANTGVAPPNSAPELTNPGNQQFNVGDDVSFRLQATDADNDTLTFSVDELPAGLRLTERKKLRGTPTSAQTVTTTVTVSDGALEDQETFTWTIGDSSTPSGNEINVGDSVTGSVVQNGWTVYTIPPSGNERSIDIEMSELTRDIDLYVRANEAPTVDQFDCRSWLSDTQTEQCPVTQAADQTLYVGVHGYSIDGNYRLTVSDSNRSDTTVLSVGTPITNTLGQGQWAYYTVNNPQSLQNLKVTMDNLSADLDMYTRTGAKPTQQQYECRPWEGEFKTEICNLPRGDAADVIVGVRAPQAGSYQLTLETGGNGGADLTFANREPDLNGNGEITVGAVDADQTFSDSVTKDGWQYFKVTGGSPGNIVVVSLYHMTEDADLYVAHDRMPTLQDFDCRSFAGNSLTENCTVSIGIGDTWIGVHGYTESRFRLSTTIQQGIGKLALGQQHTGNIAEGQWHFFAIQHPASNNGLAADARLTEMSADIDLYSKTDGFPGLTDFDCRSFRSRTADDNCAVSLTSTTSLIGVYGFKAGQYTLSLGDTPVRRSKLVSKMTKDMDVKAAVSASGNAVKTGSGGMGWSIALLVFLAGVRRSATAARSTPGR